MSKSLGELFLGEMFCQKRGVTQQNFFHFRSMTRKIILAKIPCKLMTKEQQVDLGRQEQAYIPYIPKSILHREGITEEELSWDLVKTEDNRICLILKRTVLA